MWRVDEKDLSFIGPEIQLWNTCWERPLEGDASQDSDALVSQGRKSRRKPMQKVLDKFKKFDSPSLRYVKRVSRKRKDHRWCQSSSSAKSLRCEIRGSVPWRDWKTRAMYPKQGLGPCPKHLQAQSERQGYILLACRNWVLPSASARQPEEREFVVDSGASMHMVSEQDLNSAELETMSTSRSPTTVMTAKREVRTNKEATICVKQLDLLRQSYASSRNSRSACSEETLRWTWVCVSLEKWSESATHQEWQENWLQYIQLCTICGSRNLIEFFLNHAFICLVTIFITGVNIGKQWFSIGEQVWKIQSQKEVEVRVKSFEETRWKISQKPKNKIKKKKIWRKVQRDISHELPDWLQELNENLVDERISEELRGDLMHTLPVRTVFTHFPKDPNCGICLKTKITRASCRRRANAVMPRAEKIRWFDYCRSKFSVKKVNRGTIIDVTGWCKTWPPNGSSRIRAKQKLLRKHKRSLQKFLEPNRKPKVIYTDYSLELGKDCEDLSWNHDTSVTNGIAERAVRRVKEGTSAVLLHSGLDGKWWADSQKCFIYLRNIQDLLSDGKTPYKRRFGQPFKGPIIPFGSLVENFLNSAKDQSRLHQVGATVFPGLFLGYALHAERDWKGDLMVTDIEELKEMDATEIHARRLNAKQVLSPWRSGNFIFPIADGTVKICGWEQRLGTSTLARDRLERGEEEEILQGKSDELDSPTQLQEDSTRES